MAQEFLTDDEKAEVLEAMPDNTSRYFVKKQLDKPIQYGWVQYYYHQAEGKCGPYRVSLTFGSWLDRNLRNKGLADKKPFATRMMTRREAIEDMIRYRFHLQFYYSWDELMDDDRATSVPDTFIATVAEFSKTHPLVKPEKR